MSDELDELMFIRSDEPFIYANDDDLFIEFNSGKIISLNKTLEKIELVLKKLEELNAKNDVNAMTASTLKD